MVNYFTKFNTKLNIITSRKRKKQQKQKTENFVQNYFHQQNKYDMNRETAKRGRRFTQKGLQQPVLQKAYYSHKKGSVS